MGIFYNDDIVISWNEAIGVVKEIVNTNSDSIACRDVFIDSVASSVLLRESNNGYLANVSDLNLDFLPKSNNLMDKIQVPIKNEYDDMQIEVRFAISCSDDLEQANISCAFDSMGACETSKVSIKKDKLEDFIIENNLLVSAA